MSAPRTNIETQKRWHRGPLVGMVVVVIFALGLFLALMVTVADDGRPVDNGEGQINGATGESVAPTAEDPTVVQQDGAPAVQPPATEPTATEPTATEPTATEPTATEPPAAAPSTETPSGVAPATNTP